MYACTYVEMLIHNITMIRCMATAGVSKQMRNMLLGNAPCTDTAGGHHVFACLEIYIWCLLVASVVAMEWFDHRLGGKVSLWIFSTTAWH